MAWNFEYSPYSAISGASRIIGQSQRAREEEERRRQQAQADRQFALDSQRLIDANAARSFDQGQKVAEFQEGQRRFDVGLQSNLYNQQANRSADEREAALRYSGGGGWRRGGGGSGGGSTRGYSDNYANEYNKLQADIVREQMERETGAADDQRALDRQTEVAMLTSDAQLRNHFLQQEPPQHIVAGLKMGRLRYSQHQDAERKKLQDSITAARSDPKLTMGEKMRFEAQQLQAIAAIDNNPEPVSPKDWPVPLNEQFDQTTFVHPELGPMQQEWRNDAMRWVPVDSAYKNPQLEQQKVMAAEAEDRRKEEETRRKAQLDQWKWQADFQKDILQNQYKQAQEALANTEPYQGAPKYEKGKDENGKPIIDTATFEKDMAAWQQKSDKLHADYDAKLAQYGSIPAQLMAPMAPSFPTTPGMQQQAPQMPIEAAGQPAPFQQSPAQAAPPVGPPMEQPPEDEAPVPVTSKAELDALPPKTLYIAPDGSVWRK